MLVTSLGCAAVAGGSFYQPRRDSVPATWPEKLVDGDRILLRIDPGCGLDCDLVGGHKIQVPDTTQGFGNLPLSWYFHS